MADENDPHDVDAAAPSGARVRLTGSPMGISGKSIRLRPNPALERVAERMRASIERIELPPKGLGYLGPRTIDVERAAPLQISLPRAASADDIADVADELRRQTEIHREESQALLTLAEWAKRDDLRGAWNLTLTILIAILAVFGFFFQ